MRFQVRVILRSSKTGVESQSDGSFVVRLSALPIEGKANEQLITLIARHFRVAKSLVRVVRGKQSRIKMIEIDGK